ncbi:xanthine dehydrogenase small subunit [Pectobacterium colocasium]|uniref:xanthine dehydrogenase small subunit n=1 Tax=Pectobacterium colocasium TaxID=2878098 RepID=UPI003B288AB0
MIRFLLNQTLKTLTDTAPDTTLLRWLRTQERRTGSKEGCASGDCGACTIVIGEPTAEGMAYQTANSCIMLMSQLHGKQLLTVEDLSENGVLHPVQQAMADSHASQCGFCTPGFVMSTFALQKSGCSGSRHDVEQQLAGNLCRCTGYRPIISAAQQVCGVDIHDHFREQAQATAKRLNEIRAIRQENTTDDANTLPTTVAELARTYLRHPSAHLLAGGTDLALNVTQHHRPLERIIALHRVEELQHITITDETITLGAGVTLQRCQLALETLIPAFSQALERFASRQIRNQGTLAGNLANASPIGDGAPMLLALNARLVLQRGDHSRELPLDQFFLAYRQTALQRGEFIRDIIIPRASISPTFAAWKVSKRRDDDISTVFAAFNIQTEEGRVTQARIGFGGMAAIPSRAKACEQALLQHPLSDALASACAALAQDFSPLNDFRGSGDYRLAIAQNLLRRYALQQHYPQAALEVDSYVD